MRSSLLVLPCVLLAVGCSDPKRGEEISGRVLLDGKPVTAGSVFMVSEDDQLTASGFIKKDGSYTVKEPPLGMVKIAVQTEMARMMLSAPKPPKSAGKGPGSAPGIAPPNPEEMGTVYVPIPKKYERPESSGVTHQVERGKTTHDIALTAK